MSAPILSREELLDYNRLFSIFKNIKQTDEIQIISDLKLQCKNNNVSVRDFNNQLKLVLENIKKPVACVNSECLPSTIKNVGNDYTITDDGIYLITGQFTNEVCPHPIFPIRILKDINTGYEKIQIAYKRKGKWHDDIIVDRADIATKSGIIKLANYGVLVNDSNSSYLVKFFCDIEKLNEDTINPIPATATLGYSEYGFIPYSNNVIYNKNNPENERRFNLYKAHGNFNKWRDMQLQCFKYTIPKIVIAGAYASLLVEKLGINPFGIHLWGETGLGKSVAILSSASVYGYPDIKNGIVYTGNATANGLEPRLAFNKNCAFYLDELSMLSYKQIDDMIYLIMQGQGKARMSRNGNSKDTYYWNLVSISNAEYPITNDLSKGGIFNRIYQIGADDKIFGDLNLQFIAQTFKDNYGFGAQLFIGLLDDPNIKQEIIMLKKHYYDSIIVKTEDKQANAGACILTAFEIARKYVYKTDLKLSVEEVLKYLSTPDEISQVLRAYGKLGDWIDGNYKMFDDSDIGYNQSKWGSENKIKNEINIYPFKFSEFCQSIGNINERQFLTGLRQHDLIRCMKNELKNNVQVNDKIVRMITVKKLWVEAISENHKQGKLREVINEDDLPF